MARTYGGTNVAGTGHQLHDDSRRILAEAMDMRHRDTLLAKQAEDVRLAAQFRERADVAAALAADVQAEDFLPTAHVQVPGWPPARQALHGCHLAATQPFNEGSQLLFDERSGAFLRV